MDIPKDFIPRSIFWSVNLMIDNVLAKILSLVSYLLLAL
jgi:hypothetical protein